MRAWRKALAATAALGVCAVVPLAGMWAGLLRVPLVRVPLASGRWTVGTVTLDLPRGAGAKPLDVQLWYPAPRGARGRPAPYVFRSKRPWRARLLDAIVVTGALADAPCAERRFPVIVYVPGWGGSRENGTALVTDLASNGYVVAGINDSYPDPAMDLQSDGAKRQTIRVAERKLRLQMADVATVLDGLTTLAAAGGRFERRLDLARIGIVGFSFGGAVAAEMARVDLRVRAAVNLDGWLFGKALTAGVARPFLIFSAPLVTARAAPARYADDAARVLDRFDRENETLQLAGLRRHGGFIVTVEGVDHYNFTDAGWLPSVRHTGVGPIDGRRAQRIITAYVRQFFDRSLQETPAPLFDTREPFDPAARLIAIAPQAKPPFR